MSKTIGDVVARLPIEKDMPVVVKMGKSVILEECEGRHGTYFTAEVEATDGVRQITLSRKLLDKLIEAGMKTWETYRWVRITRTGGGFTTSYTIEEVDTPE